MAATLDIPFFANMVVLFLLRRSSLRTNRAASFDLNEASHQRC
jgi:hypothetical protein